MTLYALDAIDDAIDATRSFLWPFQVWQWARLALIVFFIGGVGGFNPLQFGGSPPTGAGVDSSIPSDALPSIGEAELAIIAGIIAIIALIAIVFMIIGSIMEFVFVESLSREAVSIRHYWGDHWGQGLRLFGFRLVLSIFTLGLIGIIIAIVLAPVLFGNAAFSIGLLFLAIPAVVVIAIVAGLITGFTTVFVVAVMIQEDRGLVSAWRRFWPTMTRQWKQYAAYAVMGFVLQLAGGIITGIATLIGAVVLAIPFGLVGLLGVGLLTVSEIAGWVVIAIVVGLFGLTLVVAALFIAVPVKVFLRYYALLVLGDTNETFDLIPEQRAAVRD